MSGRWPTVVERFYAAFEARDLDEMSDLWIHDDSIACTHPGWATLHGWASVSASWFGIFDQSSPMQVFLTDQRVHVDGDIAWVTVDENLLGAASDEVGTTVAALEGAPPHRRRLADRHPPRLGRGGPSDLGLTLVRPPSPHAASTGRGDR